MSGLSHQELYPELMEGTTYHPETQGSNLDRLTGWGLGAKSLANGESIPCMERRVCLSNQKRELWLAAYIIFLRSSS